MRRARGGAGALTKAIPVSILSLAFCVYGLPYGVAWGCECGEVPQRAARRVAAVVFRGRVIEIEHVVQQTSVESPARTESRPPNAGDGTVVTFEVDAGWKGPVTSTMKAFAIARGTVCPGYIFETVGANSPCNRVVEIVTLRCCSLSQQGCTCTTYQTARCVYG